MTALPRTYNINFKCHQLPSLYEMFVLFMLTMIGGTYKYMYMDVVFLKCS